MGIACYSQGKIECDEGSKNFDFDWSGKIERNLINFENGPI
jgi:hypothetical protein